MKNAFSKARKIFYNKKSTIFASFLPSLFQPPNFYTNLKNENHEVFFQENWNSGKNRENDFPAKQI